MSSPPDIQALLAHHEFLRALAQRLVRDAVRADDLVQETWLAVMRRSQGPEGSPRAWLSRVLANLAWKRSRADLRSAARERSQARSDLVPSAEQIASWKGAQKQLLDAVLAMAPKYRDVLLLRYYREMPPRVIAAHLQVPVETVRTRIKRGLDQLGRALDSEYDGDRRAWVVAFAPFAAWKRTAASTAAWTAGATIAATVFGIVLWTAAGGEVPQESNASAESAVAAPRESGPAPAGAESEAPATKADDTAEQTPRIGGRILDHLGRPVPDAQVLAYPSRRARVLSLSATSSEGVVVSRSSLHGRFSIPRREQAEPCHLFVKAPRHSVALLRDVRPGSAAVEIVLPAPRSIAGVVQDGRGVPVAEAAIELKTLIGCVEVAVQTTADASGAFTLEGVPASNCDRDSGHLELMTYMSAKAPGLADLFTRVPLPEGDVDLADPLRLVMLQGSSVAGSVVDGDTGLPIADARVRFQSLEGLGDWYVVGPGLRVRSPFRGGAPGDRVTDEQGRFQLNRLPARGYHMPVPAAQDANGHAVLGVITVQAPGYAPAREWFRLPRNGVPGVLRIPCWRTASLAGRVVDDAGRGLAGVEIEASGGVLAPAPARDSAVGRWLVQTGSDGRYRIDGLPAAAKGSSVQVAARWPQLAAQWDRQITVEAGQSLVVEDLVVARPRAVEVQVATREGRPLPSAWCSLADGALLRADEGGSIRLLALANQPPVIVRAAGFVAARVAIDGNEPVVRLRLDPARRIDGRVLWSDGSPAANVVVLARVPGVDLPSAAERMPGMGSSPQAGGPYASARTGAAGRFRIDELPELRCTLSLVLPALPPRQRFTDPARVRALLGDAPGQPTTVEAEDREVELLIPRLPPENPRGEVRALVRYAGDGRPALAPYALLADGEREILPLVDGPGQLRFTSVPAGDWVLRVRTHNSVPTLHRLRVNEGETVGPLNLELKPGLRIHGRVKLARHTESEGPWSLWLIDEVGRVAASAALDDRNEFSFAGLSEGTYRLRLSARASDLRMLAVTPAHVVLRGADHGRFIDVAPERNRLLEIRVDCPRLPVYGKAPASREEENLRRASRLMVRDSKGRIVEGFAQLWRGVAYPMLLPAGEYEVVVEVAGAPFVRRRVELREGEARLEVFEIP